MDFLSGKKTYLVSALMVFAGAMKYLWPDLVPFIDGDAITLVLTGSGLSALRGGVSKS